MFDKKVVFKIIDSYFKTRKNQFEISQFDDAAVLIKIGIVNSINNKQIKINIKSNELNETLLEYIENNQAKKIPKDIKEAFNLIDKFEKQKKTEFGYSNIINAYSEIIDAVKSYIFYTFHTKEVVDIISFFKALSKREKYFYDEYLLESLLLIDINSESLYEILSLLKSNNEITQIPEFCSRLGKIKPELANNLYDYALQKNDKEDFYILANLLFGLFETDTENAFLKTKRLLEINPSMAYFTLGRLQYKQESHIRECFDIAEKANKSNIESLLQIPYIYQSLIENSIASKEIRKKCFSKMQKLFSIDNEQLRNSIFTACRFLHGHEEERYRLLLETFLSKTQNYHNRISDYFYNFTNSDYFFHLFAMLYDIHYRNRGTMIDIRIFSEALSHFWKIDKVKTEKHLLNLLSHDMPHLRISGVDLIRSKHFGFYDVNMLNLDTSIKQLRALEALFFQSFYNIDDFLPLILTLYNSPHEAVVTYIQSRLSSLIINSYHDHLYDEVAKHINDEKFMKPLKDSLDSYHKMREVKTSINDLDPRKNEHDLMNLYYTLEQEEQHKLMHKINHDDNSFLSMVKQTTIVREIGRAHV